MLKHLFLVCLTLTLPVKAKKCNNLPPNLDKITRSVDITKLDLLPLDVINGDDFLRPVVSLTCEEGKTWKNANGTNFDLPDQVWQITTVPSGWLSPEINTYKSHADVREAMINSAGVDSHLGRFAFSDSNSYKKLQHTIATKNRFVTVLSAFASTTRVDINPPEGLSLDNHVQDYINTNLNDTYDNNPDAYIKFIERYGTHYFTTAKFGGCIRVMFEITKDYFYSNENEVDINVKTTYDHLLGEKQGSIDEKFTKSSVQTVKYYGGDVDILSKVGFRNWQPSVEKNPWLFSGTVKPISNLINNQTIQDSMIKAVKIYEMKSFLNDLRVIITKAKEKSDNSVINSLHNRVTMMMTSSKYEELEVQTLAQDVEEYLTVPSWFSQETQLCLHWSGTSDWHQCGGGVPQLLCATPNSLTQWYADWTDWRSGGCKMKWGVESKNPPAWFKEVRLCYQWYAEDNIKQCGNHKGQTFCAAVNSYTQEYLDDTDNRKGGCKMRWKLQVPEGAPLWMRASRLCFNWQENGDIGQCGGGAPREQCAAVNDWTGYYLDDTDNRKGGCSMRWGIKTSN
ncbi:perivitellin-2 67 kDa subunit-like [Physella acuta]|uniref:perivitellin-2 67 kDa subunit-like n=1 Tax=Physella acuta TaxID=109671 RepID=UPI0027DE38DC|nr:perivitellin-2 67 kDa subunit-like [Physella acuta]